MRENILYSTFTSPLYRLAILMKTEESVVSIFSETYKMLVCLKCPFRHAKSKA